MTQNDYLHMSYLLKLSRDFYLFKIIIEVIQYPAVTLTQFKPMFHFYTP